MGNKYVRERSFNELSTKIMEEVPAEGEEHPKEKHIDQRTNSAASIHKSQEQPPVPL
jgi:hypothetical protein